MHQQHRHGGAAYRVARPLEFMRPPAALVPRPRLHLIRFHGVLAPSSKLRALLSPQRSEVVHATKTAMASEFQAQSVRGQQHRISSARLVKRVFDIDTGAAPTAHAVGRPPADRPERPLLTESSTWPESRKRARTQSRR
jgi:hypothetical protein